MPRNHFFENLDEEVNAAVRAAIDHLESSGVEFGEIAVPEHQDGEMLGAHTAIDLAEVATNRRRIYAENADTYLPDTKLFIEMGFFVRVTTYIDALRARPHLLSQVLESMKGVDALVVPSQPIVAPRDRRRTWPSSATTKKTYCSRWFGSSLSST